MSVEWFLKLKEFDSLSKVRINHLNALKEQEDRVSKLKSRLDENLSQTTILNQSVRDTEQEMFDLEKQLKLLTIQQTRLVEVGESDKAQTYEVNIESLEAKGLALLDKIEEQKQELADLKTFKTGVEKTIQEIEEEANNEKETLQKEIKNIDLRLEGLQTELPSDFQNILSKTMKKNLAHGPFTRVESSSCFFCRYKMSRMEESEVDMQKMLRVCPQCSRIFLPYGS